ncbi:MAG TPA: metal-sulfur cluster assembly factor [Caldilineae bacterium]|nr:metal-sulfur cluster assembly factor [Caldilineae bacterium]
MPTVEEIRAVLKENVYDPEIMINIVDLGLVYDIQIDEERKAVTIDMTLTSPGCPIGPQIIRNVEHVVREAFPELEDVQVNLVWTPLWNPEMMSEEAKDRLGFF